MANPIDFSQLIDKKFGRLLILKEGEPHMTKGGHKHRTAVIRCDCGTIKQVQISIILSGQTTSCGCFQREAAAKRMPSISRIHGGFGTPEFESWCQMKKRCKNPKHKSYNDYGGRGIQVCDRWRDSFENFLKDMGHRPSAKHSIDRIDVNGNYEPSNCRWATKTEQSRNQRNNVVVEYNGQKKCLAEWSEITGISWQGLYYRIFVAKVDIHTAMTAPVNKAKKLAK